MALVTGTILVKVNGNTLEGRSVKIKFGGYTKEAQTSAGVAGRHYFRKPEPSMVSVTVAHYGYFSLEEINAWDNVTLVVETDSGQTFQIDGAYVSNSIELGDEGAGISIEFTGPPAQAV